MPTTPPTTRTALVHDWLDTWRGGENVLAALVGLYPQADLFAVVDFLPDDLRGRIAGKRATTTFIQRLPFAQTRFRSYLPLMPRAIESLDLGAYDLVISSSHAVAKGVRTRPDQLHVCYCLTPMRYAWDLSEQYLEVSGIGRGLRGLAARALLGRLRDWDRRASGRVDHFIAISDFIRERIRRCYDRDAAVIHPPVDVDFFTPPVASLPPASRRDFVTASRWVPYKRVEAIVAAFRELPDRRLVVVGDGPQARQVRAAAGPNVEFVGELPRQALREALRRARAFVFAAEEDFGILPVEAQACGTPVIAFGRGGTCETVVGHPAPGATGLFFAEQSPGAIAQAVRDFDRVAEDFRPESCVQNAARFGGRRFAEEFLAQVALATGNRAPRAR